MVDFFVTIAEPTTGAYKEKNSKFIAYVYPIIEESEIEAHIGALKTIHPKASHYCYAYKIGIDNNRFRTNDDGEPSGTAGKPIFGQILSHGLTNIIIFVVRYFGGTKLGASGLIHAYKEAAREALLMAKPIEKFITKSYSLHFGYEHMGQILNVVKDLNLDITYKNFETECIVVLEIRLSIADSMMLMFKSKLLNISVEYIQRNTEIPFCKVLTLDGLSQ